mgnify:CR=1 FL=1
MKKENIPNILTIIRFILIPFIFFSVISHHYLTALIIFTLSAITDVLDGYIARKYNYITDKNYQNALQDVSTASGKLTQISLLLSLTILNILPWWIFAIVFIKEVLMVTTASLLYKKKDVVVYSKWYGKLATVLFYLAIVMSLLMNNFDLGIPFRIDLYLYYLAILATLFSLIMYAIQFVISKFIKAKK